MISYRWKYVDFVEKCLNINTNNVYTILIFPYNRCYHEDERFLTTIKASEAIFTASNLGFHILPKFVQSFLVSGICILL